MINLLFIWVNWLVFHQKRLRCKSLSTFFTLKRSFAGVWTLVYLQYGKTGCSETTSLTDKISPAKMHNGLVVLHGFFQIIAFVAIFIIAHIFRFSTVRNWVQHFWSLRFKLLFTAGKITNEPWMTGVYVLVEQFIGFKVFLAFRTLQKVFCFVA